MGIWEIIDTLNKGKLWAFGKMRMKKFLKLRDAIDEAVVLLAVYQDAGVDNLREHVNLFRRMNDMDDYISREKMLDTVAGSLRYLVGPAEQEAGMFLKNKLEAIPTERVAPKRDAHWIKITDGLHKCSFCHTARKTDVPRDHYCPNCGANMLGEKEEGEQDGDK